MINKIHFTNYKSFKEEQCLELKPMTILIGKNSSGKSAVAKLPTLIEGSLSRDFIDPLLVQNNGVELGAEFRDLIYGRQIGSLKFILEENENKLYVEVTSGTGVKDLPKIRKWRWNEDEIIFDYHSQNSVYLDAKKQKSDIQFSGFLPTNLGENFSINLKTNYTGPFRIVPERSYNSRGSTKIFKVGNKGKLAYQILITDFLYNNSQLLKQVNKWYQNNFSGWGIQINDTNKPDYKIELFRNEPKFSVNITDVGEGMSQALPLVVSALLEHQEEMLTIIEQPELHLHPAAHGNLAELFAEQSKNINKKFLIETHSQNFVLRLRRMIAEKKIGKNDLMIYYVEYDEESNISNLKEILVDNLGNVDYWPEGVFSETLDETIAIRTAQLNQKS